MISHGLLHHTILKHIIEKGFAPSVAGISEILHISKPETRTALQALAEYHGVVLHPDNEKIWVIHPFSLAPTPFLVQSEKGKWWGNCVWCSLGVAAILKEDCTITTTSGAHSKQITLTITNGEIQEKDLLIHFPIPMAKAWDNVIYTCSTMLVFQSNDEITEWCRLHNINQGDVQRVEKIWKFSQKWYGNHLDKNWTKWTTEEAIMIFKEFDLTHPIWEIQSGSERF